MELSLIQPKRWFSLLPPWMRAGLLSAAVIVLGYLIALKIYHVPTRKDILIFFSLLSIIPTVKFPVFGVYYLFVVPAFIPFVRRFYYTFYARPGQDLFHVVPDVVLILLSIVYLDRVRKGAKPWVEDRNLGKWMWAFFLYQLIRVFLGSYMTTMEGLNKFKFAALYIMCFFIAIHFITNMKQVAMLFRITSVMGLIAAAYGIKQALIGYTAFEEIWLKYMKTTFVTLFIAGIPRPFSLLASPACFADLMLVSIVTSFALSSRAKGAPKMFYVLSIPVMIYGLLLTSVRSNWMALPAGAVLWFIIAWRASFRTKVVMTAVALITAVLVNTGGGLFSGPRPGPAAVEAPAAKTPAGARNITEVFVKERISALASPFQEGSVVSRLTMWKTILEHTLWMPQGPFGWGMGSFEAHSYYFAVLADIGYPGVFLLLFIIARVFIAGARAYIQEEDEKRRVFIRAIGVILFMITFVNTTGVHIEAHPADVYYWFFSGLLLTFRRLKDDASQAGARSLLNDAT